MQNPTILVNSCYFAGISWFMNCLIELNVRVDEATPKIFEYKAPVQGKLTEYSLLDTATDWMAALPSLVFRDRFYFRNDAYCVFLSHEFNVREIEKNKKTLVFVRDPRDILFTTYHFDTMGLSFADWIRTHRHDLHWAKLVSYYLSLNENDRAFFRFEDYKRDPTQQLKSILQHTDIHANDQQIALAIANSSYEKTKEGEKIYKERYPIEKRFHGDKVRNRSGKTGEWRTHSEEYHSIKIIEDNLAPLMRIFGYEPVL